MEHREGARKQPRVRDGAARQADEQHRQDAADGEHFLQEEVDNVAGEIWRSHAIPHPGVQRARGLLTGRTWPPAGLWARPSIVHSYCFAQLVGVAPQASCQCPLPHEDHQSAHARQQEGRGQAGHNDVALALLRTQCREENLHRVRREVGAVPGLLLVQNLRIVFKGQYGLQLGRVRSGAFLLRGAGPIRSGKGLEGAGFRPAV
mmetsp:Transcript_7977/g.29848  ORF Transcript_7977/g.29848 Transcript_7977/m.29848 type:complete len:204 (-) Transcript_7977:340-951(-)